tara:strand:- start:503 stop:853 length:351 start_codon:yes stop_codon:yes gene_type:complete
MNQREAYQNGKRIGIACAEASFDDQRWLQIIDWVFDDADFDKFSDDVYDRKEGYESFSPWEIFAHEINETGDRAESLWDNYENGFGVGMKKTWNKKAKLKRSQYFEAVARTDAVPM